MAVIDRVQLLADEKTWLPPENVLTDEHMTAINEIVIKNQIPEDDEKYYSEALCKGLMAMGIANNSQYQVSQRGIKKQKVGDVEIEKYERTSINPWMDYLKSLKDVCPLFGYTGLNSGLGMAINPGDVFRITNEAATDKLLISDYSCPGIGLYPDYL